MKVAIYCRLSEEDRNKLHESDDSNSIKNQKAMPGVVAGQENGMAAVQPGLVNDGEVSAMPEAPGDGVNEIPEFGAAFVGGTGIGSGVAGVINDTDDIPHPVEVFCLKMELLYLTVRHPSSGQLLSLVQSLNRSMMTPYLVEWRLLHSLALSNPKMVFQYLKLRLHSLAQLLFPVQNPDRSMKTVLLLDLKCLLSRALFSPSMDLQKLLPSSSVWISICS